MRIVSLLPSTTEILFAIGAGDETVGVTFECDHPAEARTRTIVSLSTLPSGLGPPEIDAMVKERIAAGEDLYRLDEGALRDLDPDVIVTQDLCAVCAVDVKTVDEALEHLGCRAAVVTVDPVTLEEVLESVEVLGDVTDHRREAATLVRSLRQRLESVAAALRGQTRPRVAVLEWTDPLFCAGHWIPDVVDAAGGVSVLGGAGERSREIGADAVAAAAPDVIVVAPCGYRLEGAVRLASELHDAAVLPGGVDLWAVDADALLVRPGPRLVDGVETLAGILHPEVFEVPAGTAQLISARRAV